ncbi:hypothetical protein H8S95_06545 [Pontibacter sp. KCTC 32443]|uniref:hypothetical protein n=1 Tax=Pontibacter TaxID=323449 RepID=UPI00164ECC51|nr:MULTISPECIES: hypothetical protein [Pontibacter]MBC5773715.1 hypothetical protein [Pontibacter sp. KCTC 32443]
MSDSVFDYLEVLVLVGLFFFLLTHHARHQELIYKNIVLLFIAIPILSAVGALVFHDQSLSLSLLVLRANFFWLFYFLLHLFNIEPKKIIYLMIVVGLVWVLLTVVQQFTYPDYYFATRTEDESYYFLRAGVYRFMLNGHHYGVFITLYFFYNFLVSRKLTNLVFVFIGLSGFYYYGTRQFALALLACMILVLFMVKGKTRFLAFTSLSVCALVIFFYQDVLFGEYVEMTNNQMLNEDEVRLISAHYFLFEYWPHWLTKVIGNGIPHSLSNYGKEIDYIKENLQLFRSDIGIIGAFNQFGIFYVLNIFWLNIKSLRSRYYTEQTKYLKLIFLYSLLLLLMSEYYANASAIPFFCFILYLVDKSYESTMNEQTKNLNPDTNIL